MILCLSGMTLITLSSTDGWFTRCQNSNLTKSNESGNRYIQIFVKLLMNVYVIAKISADQKVVWKNQTYFHMDSR